MKTMPESVSEALIVGLETKDDAAVFKLSDDVAIVQTLDFITPIVDNPYIFGQVTAANALSDIYAMGGKPVTAMNLAGFPCHLDFTILAEILEGGRSKVEEAGAVIVGGHTVEDAEPKYGLSVTGVVPLDRIIKVNGAQPGDALVLTKPLGTGILATALKRGSVSEDGIKEAIEGMICLNEGARDAMLQVETHAATDITGFGLLGHLYNMVHESAVSARIYLEEMPVWPDVREFARKKMIAGGLKKNWEYLETTVDFAADIDDISKAILFDPQTSGGLLISVTVGDLDVLVELLREYGAPAYAVIGHVAEGVAGHIDVESGR